MTDLLIDDVHPSDHVGGDVEIVNVSKRFGGAPALSNVSVTVRQGKVHSFVGENGAGKSTLGKVISGVHSPDSGEVRVGGNAVSFRSPRDAMTQGIVTIAQELAVVPYLTVMENVFMGAEPRRWGFVKKREMRKRYNDLTERVGFRLPANHLAGTLVTADQQKLEILRALSRNASLIIMDEPSAALSMHEVTTLHQIIRSLAANGQTVVLISHFLSEVLALSDQITILRDGKVVRTIDAVDATEEILIEGMLGRTLSSAYPEKRFSDETSPVVLNVEGLSAPGVHDATLSVRAGEIVGLAGLVGSGRSEFAAALFGSSRVSKGRILIGDVDVTNHHPHQSLRQGMALIPESRKEQGLLMGRPISENVSLSSLAALSTLGVMSPRREHRSVKQALNEVRVKMASSRLTVHSLSGGNQQKVLFARTSLCAPKVLIADEPTRGVDVGSKRTIYDVLVEQAAQGLAVIVISSELEEVLGLAHRVIVMRGGRFVAELSGDAMTQEAILQAAFSESSPAAS